MDIAGLTLEQKRAELVSALIRRDREQKLIDLLRSSIEEAERKTAAA